jgi:hypothetical protein
MSGVRQRYCRLQGHQRVYMIERREEGEVIILWETVVTEERNK